MFIFYIILPILAYLDHNKVKYAIDVGNQYYYKDRSRVLFRFDQNYERGVTQETQFQYHPEQIHHLLSIQYLDFKIFNTERYLVDDDQFKYTINLKLQEKYTLLLALIETKQDKEKQTFDIYFEGTPIVENMDIVEAAGGYNIPVYYDIEFEYKDKAIFIGNNSVWEMADTKLTLDVVFKGKSAKLSAIILYQGTVDDILADLESVLLSKDLIEATFINQSDFVKALKQKALRYAMKMKGKPDNNNLISRVSQYLSPFQFIIKEYHQASMSQAELQNTIENSTIELFFESIFYFILIPLGTTIINCLEFIFNNKLFIGSLFCTSFLLYYCLNTTSNNNQLKIQSSYLKDFTSLEFTQQQQKMKQYIYQQ